MYDAYKKYLSSNFISYMNKKVSKLFLKLTTERDQRDSVFQRSLKYFLDVKRPVTLK
jgi:hypothetical protein